MRQAPNRQSITGAPFGTSYRLLQQFLNWDSSSSRDHLLARPWKLTNEFLPDIALCASLRLIFSQVFCFLCSNDGIKSAHLQPLIFHRALARRSRRTAKRTFHLSSRKLSRLGGKPVCPQKRAVREQLKAGGCRKKPATRFNNAWNTATLHH